MWNDEQIFKDRSAKYTTQVGLLYPPPPGWTLSNSLLFTGNKLKSEIKTELPGSGRYLGSLPPCLNQLTFLTSLPPDTESYKAEMSLRTSPWSGNGQIFILNNAHVRNE